VSDLHTAVFDVVQSRGEARVQRHSSSTGVTTSCTTHETPRTSPGDWCFMWHRHCNTCNYIRKTDRDFWFIWIIKHIDYCRLTMLVYLNNRRPYPSMMPGCILNIWIFENKCLILWMFDLRDRCCSPLPPALPGSRLQTILFCQYFSHCFY
jgi:hypothetical protein